METGHGRGPRAVVCVGQREDRGKEGCPETKMVDRTNNLKHIITISGMNCNVYYNYMHTI